jgi:signal transduction histidine kinase
MIGRIERVLGDRRLRRAGDAALALLLAAVSLVDLLVSKNPASSWGGRGAIQVIVALALTLPLALRARFPILVAAVVNVAGGLLVVLAAPHQPAFEAFVADVLAIYSLGAHTRGRRAWAGLALMFVLGIPFAVAASDRGFHAANFAAPVAWTLGFWMIGQIIQGRRRRTRELEALTRELEAQRDLQAQAAVSVERGRIARELHDIVAHNVSMMVVQAGAAARVLEGEQPHVRDALATIAETGRLTVDEMRTLLGVLRANEEGLALSPQPGLGDLEQLCGGIRQAGLPVALRVEGEAASLPQALDLSAFRIVQEALTNTLKYAGPATAEVTVRYQNGAVELEISDTGEGRANGHGTGHGLIGMRERVAMFGGDLEAGRREDGGFTVRARLPLSAATQA